MRVDWSNKAQVLAEVQQNAWAFKWPDELRE